MLEHHADAGVDRGARIGEADRFAGKPQFAAIGLLDAEQDLHQRRLAGAVLADDGMHLAGLDGEVHAVIGDHPAGVGLADADRLEKRRHDACQTPSHRAAPAMHAGADRTIVAAYFITVAGTISPEAILASSASISARRSAGTSFS